MGLSWLLSRTKEDISSLSLSIFPSLFFSSAKISGIMQWIFICILPNFLHTHCFNFLEFTVTEQFTQSVQHITWYC